VRVSGWGAPLGWLPENGPRLGWVHEGRGFPTYPELLPGGTAYLTNHPPPGLGAKCTIGLLWHFGDFGLHGFGATSTFGTQRQVGGQFAHLGPASLLPRRPVGSMRLIPVAAVVASHLPTDRPHRPAQPACNDPKRLTASHTPKDLLSFV
jgi:hypothetical protein